MPTPPVPPRIRQQPFRGKNALRGFLTALLTLGFTAGSTPWEQARKAGIKRKHGGRVPGAFGGGSAKVQLRKLGLPDVVTR